MMMLVGRSAVAARTSARASTRSSAAAAFSAAHGLRRRREAGKLAAPLRPLLLRPLSVSTLPNAASAAPPPDGNNNNNNNNNNGDPRFSPPPSSAQPHSSAAHMPQAASATTHSSSSVTRAEYYALDPSLRDAVTIVRTRAEARVAVAALYAATQAGASAHACDTEVADIDLKSVGPVGNGYVTCVSIFSGPGVDYGDGPGKALWIDNIDEAEGVLQEFKDWFEDESQPKVWHNYGFDRHVMYNEGVSISWNRSIVVVLFFFLSFWEDRSLARSLDRSIERSCCVPGLTD